MFGLGKRNGEIDSFSIELAAELSKRFPPALEAEAAKRKTSDKLLRALNHAATQALLFQRDNKLGVYGKARLLNAFRSELARLGYTDPFIDSAAMALTRTMAGRPAEG